jgi:hypothetical protein
LSDVKGDCESNADHRRGSVVTSGFPKIRPGQNLKNDAAPDARVPAITSAANHRGWCYDNRCSRYYDNRRRGCDYDRTSIRDTSIRTRMIARTTSARSAGTANIDDE